MDTYLIPDALLRYSAQLHSRHRRTPQGTEGASLEALIEGKAISLGDILTDLRADVATRRALSQSILGDVREHSCLVASKLLQLKDWKLGANALVEGRRRSLETQLDVLRAEERRELVHCWNDVAALKQEFRKWFKEYSAAWKKMQIISPRSKSELGELGPRK